MSFFSNLMGDNAERLKGKFSGSYSVYRKNPSWEDQLTHRPQASPTQKNFHVDAAETAKAINWRNKILRMRDQLDYTA